MQFLHSRKYLNEGDVVEVNCSHQCNVRLTTDTQFSNFKNGRRHTYYGGFMNDYPLASLCLTPDTGTSPLTWAEDPLASPIR